MSSIYIHIPFCEHKCGYCDFYSLPRSQWDETIHEKYVESLCREIDARVTGPVGPLSTIYFGGGTPSILAPRLIEKILKKISEHFVWEDSCEITLEVNPGTVTGSGLGGHAGPPLLAFRDIGINRLSIGVQSFNDVFLKRLERVHSANEAKQTLEEAHKAGFDNFNLDLIFALPGQALADWEKDLREGISFGTKHLSAYNLTIEEGTTFAKIYGDGGVVRGGGVTSPLPGDDLQLQMFQRTRQILSEAGFNPYEISNFAKPGFESRHNTNYWQYGEYLGFGAGAVSMIHTRRGGHAGPPHNRGQPHRVAPTRISNTRNLDHYLEGKWSGPVEEITREQAMGEFFFLGLRQARGVSLQRFEGLFAENPTKIFAKAFSLGMDRKWLDLAGDRLSLTAEGVLFSNELFEFFV